MATLTEQNTFELFPHVADIGIRGHGQTMEKAFEMAAMALTSVVTDPQNVSPTIHVRIHLEEKDPELLFLDWINSVIYEMDIKRMLFSVYEVSIKSGVLEAQIKGETVDLHKHDPAVDIKGATLTELKVIDLNGQWLAQCVVDV